MFLAFARKWKVTLCHHLYSYISVIADLLLMCLVASYPFLKSVILKQFFFGGGAGVYPNMGNKIVKLPFKPKKSIAHPMYWCNLAGQGF